MIQGPDTKKLLTPKRKVISVALGIGLLASTVLAGIGVKFAYEACPTPTLSNVSVDQLHDAILAIGFTAIHDALPDINPDERMSVRLAVQEGEYLVGQICDD